MGKVGGLVHSEAIMHLPDPWNARRIGPWTIRNESFRRTWTFDWSWFGRLFGR